MAKVKCKKCGTTCCTCSGCNPKTYIDGLCPLCQKLERNAANSKITRVSGLPDTKKPTGASGLQFAKPS